MGHALGADASKSDAKDPVRFSVLLGGPWRGDPCLSPQGVDLAIDFTSACGTYFGVLDSVHMRCFRYRHSGRVDRTRMAIGAGVAIFCCALMGPMVWWPAPQFRWPVLLLCIGCLPILTWRIF